MKLDLFATLHYQASIRWTFYTVLFKSRLSYYKDFHNNSLWLASRIVTDIQQQALWIFDRKQTCRVCLNFLLSSCYFHSLFFFPSVLVFLNLFPPTYIFRIFIKTINISWSIQQTIQHCFIRIKRTSTVTLASRIIMNIQEQAIWTSDRKKKTCSAFQIFAIVILFSFSSHSISCFLNLLPRKECSLVSTKFYSQGWKGKNSLCASDVEKFIELYLFNGDACYAFSWKIKVETLKWLNMVKLMY